MSSNSISWAAFWSLKKIAKEERAREKSDIRTRIVLTKRVFLKNQARKKDSFSSSKRKSVNKKASLFRNK